MTDTTARPPTARPDQILRGAGMDQHHELSVTRREGAAVFHGLPDHTDGVALDLLVETLCDLLDVDYAGVHLVDADTHRVLASSDTAPHPPVPRSDSLCGVLLARHVVPTAVSGARPCEIVEVPDTAVDPSLPTGAAAGYAVPVRFYAAAPLFGPDGEVLGTLCAIAHHPRTLTATERRTLLFLGLAATRLLPAAVSDAGRVSGEERSVGAPAG